jgi:hypothetical protein
LRIDLAIIDVFPPHFKPGQRGGLGLIQTLIEKKPAMKILAVSTLATELLGEAWRMGVNGVLQKPAAGSESWDRELLDAVIAQIGEALPDVSVRKDWLLERSRRLAKASERLRTID